MRRALALCSAVYVCLFVASSADSVLNAASTIRVAAGGNLQAALDAAQPGDVILLPPGATFLGNFVLRVKSGSSFG
jgi:nitrous oxidase accessory protein NosD